MSRPTKAPPLPATVARAALESLAGAIVIVGADGGVMHLNPPAEELFGRGRDRAVGLPVGALPGGAQLAILAERARVSQESASTDFPSPQDPAVPVFAEAGPLLDGPTCVGTVVVLRGGVPISIACGERFAPAKLGMIQSRVQSILRQ